MSLSKSFYFAFLRQLLLEVKQCYLELSFDFEFRCLDELEADENQLRDHVLTLSTIGKALDTSLISNDPFQVNRDGLIPGYFDPEGFPFLLGGLFHDVFIRKGRENISLCPRLTVSNRGYPSRIDGQSGNELTTDLKTAQSLAGSVFFLRQFYLAFSKVSDIDCIAQESDEWASFEARITSSPVIRMSSELAQNARNLLALVLCPSGDMHPKLVEWLDNPVGFHGPGAVAGKEKGRGKWYFNEIPGQRPDIFDGQTTSIRGFVKAEPVSRATMVPKDFRKHRIICIEPKEFMFEQQGLWNTIAKIVAESPLTRSMISFEKQELSQTMCRSFSRFSTIDLSDASDLLSKDLARILLDPAIFKLLSASRSRQVEVNGHRVAATSLFTMGNALCFPIETLIFWALSNAAILCQDGVTIRKNCDPSIASKLLGGVRVFGDDIIIRREYFHTVIDALQQAGLKPNLSKCCHKSLVREACGAWWYAKVDCRVVRLSKANSTSLTDWCGGIEQAKAFAANGLNHVARVLLDHLNDVWPVPYGYYGLPGRRDEVDRRKVRWNRRLQRLEFECPVLTGTTIQPVPGERGLYAYFTGSATSASITRSLNKTKICWVSLTK